ncbi:hypothetical protein DFH09DRAFT_1096647 [Mycena vulgaris]|nr:hypothetical protein DFH09DRAFT_1096647 [Mycena vulgaris]
MCGAKTAAPHNNARLSVITIGGELRFLREGASKPRRPTRNGSSSSRSRFPVTFSVITFYLRQNAPANSRLAQAEVAGDDSRIKFRNLAYSASRMFSAIPPLGSDMPGGNGVTGGCRWLSVAAGGQGHPV